jgi:hypothetical protein
MHILCEVNQAECFRRGIDAPKSTIKLEVNPAKLPPDIREYIADHLYDGYKLSLEEGIPGSDLVALMEGILADQEYKKATEPVGFGRESFCSWLKEEGKESAGERLEKAKELAEAQKGSEPDTAQDQDRNSKIEKRDFEKALISLDDQLRVNRGEKTSSEYGERKFLDPFIKSMRAKYNITATKW